MNLGRALLNGLRRLFTQDHPEPVPARMQRQSAEEWVARNRCW
jgi:hypothetical protein